MNKRSPETISNTSTTPATFGELLRQYRLATGLTQEALADRAGLSVHGIQKLERGTTRPYRDTASRLALALELEPDKSEHFRAAVLPVRRHAATLRSNGEHTGQSNLPIAVTTFVPRAVEMEQVTQRLRDY